MILSEQTPEELRELARYIEEGNGIAIMDLCAELRRLADEREVRSTEDAKAREFWDWVGSMRKGPILVDDETLAYRRTLVEVQGMTPTGLEVYERVEGWDNHRFPGLPAKEESQP